MSNSIEVSLRWQDRILSVFGFQRLGVVSIGGDGRADILVPGLPVGLFDLVELGTVTKLRLAVGMRAELGRSGDMRPVDDSVREIFLAKDETARVSLPGDLLSLVVRHAPPTPRAQAMPLVDLTSDEFAGLVLALAMALVIGLYGSVLPGKNILEAKRPEEKILRAKFVFEMPQAISKVAHAVEKPLFAEATPLKPEASATKPPRPARGVPARADLLSAFASKGVSEALNKNHGSGSELMRMAGAAMGRTGDPRSLESGSNLKATGSGLDSESIGPTTGGTGGGRSGQLPGGTGYSRVAGLGTRGRAEIQIAGRDAGFSGGMDKEAIRRVIREHFPEIRNCYERELQMRPELYGKLVLEWDIESGGRVTKAKVKTDSLQSKKVAECMTAHIRSWQFPEPPANQVGRISFPFVFSAQ